MKIKKKSINIDFSKFIPKLKEYLNFKTFNFFFFFKVFRCFCFFLTSYQYFLISIGFLTIFLKLTNSELLYMF